MAKKILKIIGFVLAVLLVGAYFSYDYWLERELRYRLAEIINKDPNRLYSYHFSELNIHLVEGSVDLTGIIIEPAPGSFDSLMSENNELRFILQLNMEQIELSGFEIIEFIRTGNIVVEDLIVTKPKFKYFFHPGKKQAAHAMPLSNLFSDKFKTAELGKLLIKDAEIELKDQTKSGSTISIHHLNIELTKARLDSNTIRNFMPYERENLFVKAAGITIDATKDFKIVSDSLFFNAKEKLFGLKNFQIIPKYSQKNFANLYDVQKQWFAIKVDSLIFNHVDMDLFVNTGYLKVGEIEVIKPNIALYKDKSKPPPPFKKKSLPASAIKAIPWMIDIDSVSIKNGYVSINETSSVTGKDSRLTFEKLNGLLINLNNNREAIKKSSIMQLTASTLVLGKAPTNISLTFDLASDIDRFKVSGTVGRVEGKTFNPVLEPMMGVKVTGGVVNNIRFRFTANDTQSVGTLDADYKGIKLEVLNTDDTKSKQKKQKKGLLSMAANTVVKSNNVPNQANYLQGVINTPRVQEKDVWPYLWHSIQSGLVSTLVPITNSKQTKQQQKSTKKGSRKKRKKQK